MLDRVVVIEDELHMSDMLKYVLEMHKYNVESYSSAEQFFSHRPSFDHAIYIVDQNLPGIQGTDIVKTIRSSDKFSPVFMLSGLKNDEDVSKGLLSGADDYLFKPFHPDHLLSKINNARIKTENIIDNLMSVGIKILPEAYALINDGVTANFTPKEFVILNHLYKHQNKLVSREELVQEGFEDVIARNIDVQIFSIRKKLVKIGLEIETVRGRGYRLITQKRLKKTGH